MLVIQKGMARRALILAGLRISLTAIAKYSSPTSSQQSTSSYSSLLLAASKKPPIDNSRHLVVVTSFIANVLTYMGSFRLFTPVYLARDQAWEMWRCIDTVVRLHRSFIL